MSQYKNTNILIVDDERQMQEVLHDLLSALGINMHIANNGKEAIERLSEHEFNIVITDFNMPEINGLELIRYIRKQDDLSDVKVILMTGGADSDLSKALALVDGHIFKPFQFKHMTALIESLH